MKKKLPKVLMALLAMSTGTGMYAQTDGTYYLYNEATQTFLSRGAAWGTEAVTDKYGIPFTWNSEAGTLTFLDNNSCLFRTGTSVYTDNTTNADWVFTEVDGGYYLQDTDKTVYLAESETAGDYGLYLYTTSEQASAAVWTLKTPEERNAIVNAYATDNIAKVIADANLDITSDDFSAYIGRLKVIDMTEKVGTASFTGSVGNWTWQVVRSQGGQPAYGTGYCEVWQATGSFTQTVTDLPEGIYKVTVQGFNRQGGYAACNTLNDEGYQLSTSYLKANDEQVQLKPWVTERTETSNPDNTTQAVAAFNAGKYVNELYVYVGEEGTLDLSVNIPCYVGNCWTLFNNVTLTRYVGAENPADAKDYEALAEAIATAEEKTLGFAAGEYAPYNNTRALAILALAKDIDSSVLNEKADVQALTTALNNLTWVANTEEVNAVYDGNFAIQEAHETSGGLVLTGWDNTDDGMRQLIKNSETNLGLSGASAGAAIFTWPGSHAYGKSEGYTMPLKANTVYELSLKFAGWGTSGNNDFSVSVLNDANEGLSMTSLGKASAGIQVENSLVSSSVRFMTGEAGNYVLTVTANGNSVFTDIELLTAKAEDITVKVPAEYGTMILPFDAEVKEGMEVYSVSGYSSSTDEYSVLDLAAETSIAANTPYIVKKTGATAEFTYNGIAYSTAKTYTSGLLTGVLEATQAPVGSYVLQNQNDVLGFYLVDETVNITVPAYRAYLNAPAANEVRAFVFDLGGATSISEVAAGEDALVNVYSVSGVLVRKAVKAGEALNGLQKGIYVVNGAKIAVK